MICYNKFVIEIAKVVLCKVHQLYHNYCFINYTFDKIRSRELKGQRRSYIKNNEFDHYYILFIEYHHVLVPTELLVKEFN